MLIEVKDLMVGDEILVGSQSCLQYLKVLRPVRVKKAIPFSKWERKDENKVMYNKVYVSTRREKHQWIYTWNQQKPQDKREYSRLEYICTPDEHNMEKYIDLNYRTIWLVKRGI